MKAVPEGKSAFIQVSVDLNLEQRVRRAVHITGLDSATIIRLAILSNRLGCALAPKRNTGNRQACRLGKCKWRDVSEALPGRARAMEHCGKSVVRDGMRTALNQRPAARAYNIACWPALAAIPSVLLWQLAALAQSPLITGVKPDPVFAMNALQPFTILGTNFATNCSVTLRWEDKVFSNRLVSARSPTSLASTRTRPHFDGFTART